ncbi:MAG: SUMF1/EgtB/PvdO family nonheme iron enzyme [Planctomycetota bacterium]|jgi:formylglycine-generating enzyme required for sulfatase activity
MPDAESVCPRCDAEVQADWGYCPHCSMMLSSSQAILSDRIRYVRHERAGRSRRRIMVRYLANLSVALTVLFVVGSGILLFHPAMVPSLFRPPDTMALEPLPVLVDPGPEVAVSAKIDYVWITIEAGPYRHGPTGRTKELELHAYQILKYEVTNGQWMEYLRGTSRTRLENLSKFEDAVPDHWGWKPGPDAPPPSPRWSEDFEKPVVNITWDQARDFCHYYLSKIKGFEGARLPTKYEWQKAARGAKDERPYPWGTEYFLKGRFVRCNAREARIGAPLSVVTFAGKGVSPYGVVGMAGNVAEFVNAAEYAGDLLPGFCGGTYLEGQEALRIYEEPATQQLSTVDHVWAFVGFRAVRPVPTEGD